ncbi:MAG TPA: hypothetical protein VGD17_15160 [Chitinophagaceae bacterium]
MTAHISYGQDGTFQSIKERFVNFNSKSIHEKLYLHSDKSFYMAGDIAWFSIYNVDGKYHKPLDVSKLAYVELIDHRNIPVLQAKIELRKGKGNGSFHLPVSLNSGNYKLRAYTSWMKNFGADYFFEKKITLVNSLKASPQLSISASPTYKVNFFPEGGNLVYGLTSRTAFKVTDQYGRGIEFKGAIVNEKNDTVATFSPLKYGIGNFSFTPAVNSVYKAIIKTSDGKVFSNDLPAIHSQGYVMNVSEQAQKLKITVTTNLPSSLNGKQAFLFIHTRQVVKHAEARIFRDGVAEFVIDREVPGEGISHFTIFNDAKEPVCERLHFKYPEHKLLLETKVANTEYGARQKVNITIQATDERSNLAAPTLSISVYRHDELSLENDNNLFNYLWLTSDLKGKIQSPDYYFTDVNDETAKAMDNLMMTHGWRRFAWENALKDQPASFGFIPEYYGHVVKATVMNNKSGKPAREKAIYLSVPGSASQLYIGETDKNGNVFFDLRGYYGSGSIVVQTETEKDSSYTIDIMNPFTAEYTASEAEPFELSEESHRSLMARSVSMQVQQAYSGDSLEKFESPSIDTTSFYGKPDNLYFLDDYTRFMTMEEVFNEYVSEVIITRKNGQPYPQVMKTGEGFMQGDPLVLVDGVPVFRNRIIKYNPLKVKKLEVISNRYVLGPLVFDGIINMSTYNGNMEGLEFEPGSIVMDYEGLQLKREFYSPDHSINPEANINIPDFRTLLFWSPAIQPDAQGNVTINFFTSDLNGKYIGVVEGMDENGRAGRKVFSFEVKNAQVL